MQLWLLWLQVCSPQAHCVFMPPGFDGCGKQLVSHGYVKRKDLLNECSPCVQIVHSIRTVVRNDICLCC